MRLVVDEQSSVVTVDSVPLQYRAPFLETATVGLFGEYNKVFVLCSRDWLCSHSLLRLIALFQRGYFFYLLWCCFFVYSFTIQQHYFQRRDHDDFGK